MDIGIPLQAGESINRIIHRHWASLVPSFLSAAAPTFVAAGLAYVATRYPGTLPFPMLLVVLLVIVMILLASLFIYSAFYVFERNLFVFTNQRIIITEQLSIFNRRIAQLDLSRIQDATGDRIGFWGTVLNYGSLEIQSAGETEQFIFHYAPRPTQLAIDTMQARDNLTQAQPQPAGPTTTPTGAFL